jgi:hypothetical protein
MIHISFWTSKNEENETTIRLLGAVHIKKVEDELAIAEHSYNPSYLGGRAQGDQGFRSAGAKS